MKKDLLKIMTCGSVDDGKSTLIGRLLFDSKNIYQDQFLSIKSESKKYGTQGKNTDLALLVDGLQAEREQGITIDVAYRFFETKKRKFIIADCPGHEQYTRNMATGASNSDLAIILIDARKGLLDQTKRHSFIVSLLGIKQVLVAVNKMDLVNFDQKTFNKIKNDFLAFSKDLKFFQIDFVPISALKGDNIYKKSEKMRWFKNNSLMIFIENIKFINKFNKSFRMPVQWINRPSSNFRGYSGQVASGSISIGSDVIVAPSEKTAKVKKIIDPSGYVKKANTGQSITLVLNKELDISRGDYISSKKNSIVSSDQFSANIIWMDKKPLLPERGYTIKFSASTATAQITKLKYKYDINNFSEIACKKLELNEIANCNISLSKKIPFDSYEKNKKTGSFILIDKLSNLTIGAGMINFSLMRSQNIFWQDTKISKKLRSSSNMHKPCILWLTGLSGSGKSTIANLIEKKLHVMGKKTYLLDGDNIRHGLNKDLGFTDQDRVENIRRVSEVSKLMIDAGLIVLVSFISPFSAEREMARYMVEKGEFIEIFVDAPLKVCEKRDKKGLYKKARAGIIKNFTGISSKYEKPKNPEIILNSSLDKPEILAQKVIKFLRLNKIV